MVDSAVVERVMACVAESLAIDPSRVTPESRLVTELGADSVDFMDMMFALERAFGVRMTREDFDLVARTGLARDEAVRDGCLTSAAYARLRPWLPSLSPDTPVRELGAHITPTTLGAIIEEKLAPRG